MHNTELIARNIAATTVSGEPASKLFKRKDEFMFDIMHSQICYQFSYTKSQVQIGCAENILLERKH